jgi:hypothetical protein
MGMVNDGEKPLEMVIRADASRAPPIPPFGAFIAPELLMIVMGTIVILGAGFWFVRQRFIKRLS